MIYTSCDWVQKGIEFRQDSLRLCCFGYLQGRETEYQTVIKEDYHGEILDWKELLVLKQKYIDMHKRGEFLDACKNCIYLQTKDWPEETYINHFTLNHWTKCNCNCIYCYSYKDKKAFNSFKNYNLYPIIKDMFKNGVIKYPEQSCFSFGGGEATILEGFDKLIDLLIDNDCRNIRINSSGIKYSNSIEKGLKQKRISLVISIDSGCRETYEKIKGVKTYNKVWENIKKYAKAANDGRLFMVKYIVLPGINDNFEEIDKWFDEIIKNQVKGVSVSIEQQWFQNNIDKYVPDVNEKVEYIINRSKELGLEIEIYCEALTLLSNAKEFEAKNH